MSEVNFSCCDLDLVTWNFFSHSFSNQRSIITFDGVSWGSSLFLYLNNTGYIFHETFFKMALQSTDNVLNIYWVHVRHKAHYLSFTKLSVFWAELVTDSWANGIALPWANDFMMFPGTQSILISSSSPWWLHLFFWLGTVYFVDGTW